MATDRYRYDFSGMTPTHSYHHIKSNGDSSSSVVARSWEGTMKTIRDNRHPNFRRRIAAGEVIMGNLSIMTSTRSYTGASLVLSDPPWLEDEGTGDMAWQIEGMIPEIANAASETAARVVLCKAYAKMNESAMVVGETLNDLDKTLDMLRRPFKSAAELLKKTHEIRGRNLERLRRYGFRRAKLLSEPSAAQHMRAASDAWLETRYGWKPLMMDMDAIIDHFTETNRKKCGVRLVERSGLSFSDARSGNLGPEDPPDGVSSIRGSYASKETVKYNGGVLYTRNVFEDDDEWMTLLGLRPRDALPTLWEMTPYSFVADWFANVGDWLQALIPVPGVKILGNWVTITTDKEISCSASLTYRGDNPRGNYSGSFGGSTRTWKQADRTVNMTLPDLPVLKRTPLSRLHSADALALLTKPILSSLKSLKH